MELFIHIGLHKTATTFLQRNVFPKLESVNYIPMHDILDELTIISHKDPLLYSHNIIRTRIGGFFKPGKNLISSESLSGLPFIKYSNRKDVLYKIKKTFPSAKIIIGIRSQKNILKSLYKLYISQGGTQTINKLFFHGDGSKKGIYNGLYNSIDLDSFKYSYYLDEIEKLFGRDNMLIYIFEELSLDKNNFINHFSKFIGTSVKEINYKVVNKGYHDSSLNVLRILNYFFKGNAHEAGLFMKFKIIYKGISKIFSFTKNQTLDEVFSKTASRYNADNKKISRKYNLNLEEKFPEYFR